jgi:hypothetical protein
MISGGAAVTAASNGPGPACRPTSAPAELQSATPADGQDLVRIEGHSSWNPLSSHRLSSHGQGSVRLSYPSAWPADAGAPSSAGSGLGCYPRWGFTVWSEAAEPRRLVVGADDLEVLVDEDVVGPVDADVVDLVIAVAYGHDTVDDSAGVGGQGRFGRFGRGGPADDRA